MKQAITQAWNDWLAAMVRGDQDAAARYFARARRLEKVQHNGAKARWYTGEARRSLAAQ